MVSMSASTADALDLRQPRVKITGWISDVSTNLWRLSDRVLHIEPDSRIDDTIRTGNYAVVIAGVDAAGELHAESISQKPASDGAGYTIEFRCLIQ
jgi:hypothetical protein